VKEIDFRSPSLSPGLSPEPPHYGRSVVDLINELKDTLQGLQDKKRVLDQLPQDTRTFLQDWLIKSVHNEVSRPL